MAGTLTDADSMLPTQFLTDEDFLVDWKCCVQVAASGDCGPGSGLSNPVNSLLGSLECKSNEEDLITELSRMMACSALEDSSKAAGSKVGMLWGSPQSTLCRGWDLREATDEVARFKLREHLYSRSGIRGNGGEALYGAPGRLSPIPVPEKLQKECDGRFNHLLHQHLVANQIQQLKQQQQTMMKRQQQPRATLELNIKPNSQIYQLAKTLERKPYLATVAGTGRQIVGSSPSAWPRVQQQKGAGMSAVFLSSNGKKSACAGTGVFLPLGAGVHSGSWKKTACSTVLLPDKVVRALNLDLKNVGSQPHIQHRLDSRLSSENDGCGWNLRKIGVTAQQNPRGHSQTAALLNNEIRLPHEWTY
ncbi:hypothetical protein SAY86_007967 [Trapa natans]|uniref:Uncharacterized protein n=1 Tax=Trapa natans TaxID=22666 RepID=A0AAN7LIB4_TRANT|nr:hypothetical protein SAY86_007967 [Trapa natans]